MKALLIGCGQGGSRLTEAIMKIQCATFGSDKDNNSVKKQFDAIAINTTNDDLDELDKRFIDKRRKLLIGTGYSKTSGHGSGGNPRLGTLAANHDYLRIAAKIEEILSEVNKNPDMNDIDAFFVISALGGGSGSGMGPVIARLLKENYFEDQYPVIGIVTLPAKEEGYLNTYNAYISIQSWLKESNFDGIITVTLGGRFLNYKDNSLQYYSKFNKSVATALYILFGGAGEKSLNVDMNDLLGAIREGGGLCTLGHLSTNIAARQKEVEKTPVLTHEDAGSQAEGWEAEKLLKAVERVCNSNNLFLPIDFSTARSALLVVKDSKTFKITRGAAQQSANWLERHIKGYVRFSDINHEGFRLITDNTNEDIFREYEIEPEDHDLSQNESVEIALLLSGISDVQIIQRMREMAEKVIRLTNPPRGERLLAETLGLPVGEKIDSTMLLPCSHERDNVAAQTQSKATYEAIERFIADIQALDKEIPEDKIRKGVKVIDIKIIPDELTCVQPSSLHSKANCFEINLVFENRADSTHFKKIYVLRVLPHEIKTTEIGHKITWEKEEFIQDKPGWDAFEEKVVDDILSQAGIGGNPRISGIGRYPACSGFARHYVYKVRIAGESAPSYYYWIDAYPQPVILSEREEMQSIRSKSDLKESARFFDMLFERENEVPSTEKIESLLEQLGIQRRRPK